jgi:3-methylcrotonyl-CoA carboxylase alpha subunit
LNGLDTIAELGARRDGTAIVLDTGGAPITGHVVHGEGAVEVRLAGETSRLATRAPLKAAQAGPSDGRIIAPMPGRVLSVDVAIGQTVAAGDRLLVLEAMKMEHRIAARAAGVVTAVNIAIGDQVADGMLLVEIGAA